MNVEPLSYRFGPLERRGLLGPFTLGQFVTVAAALVIAVGLLDAVPSAGGAVLGLALVVGSATLATLPVAGRTCIGWLPIVLAHQSRRARGHHRYRCPAPARGTSAPILEPTTTGSGAATRGAPTARTAAPGRELALPRSLRGVRLAEVPYGQTNIGAVTEAGGRLLTAVLACEVGAFALLDPPAQERRLARWGAVLSSTADSPIRRLQWIERSAPAEGDALARWLHDERDPELGLRGTPLMESYLELIDSSAPVIHAQELLLAVQIDGSRVRGRGPAAQTALVEHTERIATGLEAGDVKVLGALSAEQLTRTLRTGFDPYVRGELAAQHAPRRPSMPRPFSRAAAEGTGPMACQEEWDHYRCDGALHASFWVAGWPRIDVAPMFMSALLNPSGAVRTVAVSFQPLSPERSTREVEAAITRDRADRELRNRFGQSETARQRQAHEAALRREGELAAGHGEVRFSGFVTVSGRDVDELRRSCQETVQYAALARLELRRMYGQQAEAFTFTLPLARGLA